MNNNSTSTSINWSSLYKKEDWWALWLGLLFFFLSLPSYYKVSYFSGTVGLLGWIPTGKAWTDISSALAFGAGGANVWAWVGLVATWVFLTIVLTGPMKLVGVKAKQFIVGFAVIYWIAMLLWVIANYKPMINIMGSAEVGFVFALIVGIAIGNLPKIPDWLKNSAKGEFFIKTAIVLLGAKILFSTLGTVIVPIIEAALLSFPAAWVVGYLISRRIGLERKFAVTLASGAGVCGIAACIATAGAVDAPAIYPTIVSSIIVVFAAVELLVMPYVANFFFPHNANAAGAWMGLSVKTDGAAAASGSVVSGLEGTGASGPAATMAATQKVMIDIWIGLIAFILAIVFVYFIERKGANGTTGARVSPMVIWYRFPKFVLGYIFTSLVLSIIAFTYPTVAAGQAAVAPVAANGTTPLQVMFFAFTFVAIGIATRFSNLKQVGIGRPAVAYVLTLCFAILWGGILAGWLFPG
ncbi:MAG: putative sulfate exporter family transporter [Nitrososphaerota archaeon]|nr:putative sulfate exporter family transporter [Nitrososphaerota archaeon]MDG7023677.1 putative sulfate exporter family transporter [Nitrososphaerota archaeon]